MATNVQRTSTYFFAIYGISRDSHTSYTPYLSMSKVPESISKREHRKGLTQVNIFNSLMLWQPESNSNAL